MFLLSSDANLLSFLPSLAAFCNSDWNNKREIVMMIRAVVDAALNSFNNLHNLSRMRCLKVDVCRWWDQLGAFTTKFVHCFAAVVETVVCESCAKGVLFESEWKHVVQSASHSPPSNASIYHPGIHQSRLASLWQISLLNYFSLHYLRPIFLPRRHFASEIYGTERTKIWFLWHWNWRWINWGWANKERTSRGGLQGK